MVDNIHNKKRNDITPLRITHKSRSKGNYIFDLQSKDYLLIRNIDSYYTITEYLYYLFILNVFLTFVISFSRNTYLLAIDNMIIFILMIAIFIIGIFETYKIKQRMNNKIIVDIPTSKLYMKIFFRIIQPRILRVPKSGIKSHVNLYKKNKK